MITAIDPQRGTAGRFSVFVDGTFLLGLDEELVLQAGLVVGRPLAEEEEAALRAADEERGARKRALRLLETRERSRGEVEARLVRVGYGPETVAAVADWLGDLGYLDDRRFAGLYVQDRRRAGWGPLRIRLELQRRGLPREVVDEVLEAAWEGEPEGQDDQLVAVIVRRFGRDLARDPARTRGRARDYLLRRGHGHEVAERVVGLALEEVGSAAGPE